MEIIGGIPFSGLYNRSFENGVSVSSKNRENLVQFKGRQGESLDKKKVSEKGDQGSVENIKDDVAQKLEEWKKRMIIEKLKLREKRVIAHEMAHKAVGGRYAGAIHYEYTRGPDGKLYISGGEVPIDTSEEKDPRATIRKMEIVRAAALAPADPSPQDIRVAQIATMKEIKARLELMKELQEKEREKTEKNPQGAEKFTGIKKENNSSLISSKIPNPFKGLNFVV